MQYVMPMIPIIMGRVAGGTAKDTILVPPIDMPAPPRPAMARPAIRVAGTVGKPADQTSNLKYQHGNQEAPFQVEVFEDFPSGGLCSAKGHKVRCGVPRYILDAMELIRDLGDCRANDCLFALCQQRRYSLGMTSILT